MFRINDYSVKKVKEYIQNNKKDFPYSGGNKICNYWLYVLEQNSHLHTAKALREELSRGGFTTDSVHGVMGGAWLAPNLNELLENERTKNVLMKTVRMLDIHEEIIGLSGHLLAVSRKDVLLIGGRC